MNNFMTTLTDEQLLSKGNEDFSQPNVSVIISRYMNITSMLAKKWSFKSGNKIEFEDLISEGFLGLLSAVKKYDPHVGEFRPFALTCIGNKMKSALNNLNGDKLLLDYDLDLSVFSTDEVTPEQLVISKEQSKEFRDLMTSVLSKLELQVLELYASSFNYQQIAMHLGVDAKSVDNALQRSRKKLRNYFQR